MSTPSPRSRLTIASPNPSAPTRPMNATECPSRASPTATFASAPATKRSKVVASASGPGVVATNAMRHSPRVTTSVIGCVPCRAAATAETTAAARSRIPAGPPSPSSQPPIPTATAPAAMNAGAVSRVTPPVGTSGMSGNGPRNSRTNAGPAEDAGKSLTAAAPARQAARTSVGVAQPGSVGMPRPAAQATRSASRCGMTRKVAPASIARRAASIDRTVPAPISSPSAGPTRAAASIARRASASGSLSVSSKARTPPPTRASATAGTAAADTCRPIATTPALANPAGIAGRAASSVTSSPSVSCRSPVPCPTG